MLSEILFILLKSASSTTFQNVMGSPVNFCKKVLPVSFFGCFEHCTVSRFFKWCPRWFQKVFSLQISLKSHNSHWNVEFLWIFTIECDLERCDRNAPDVLNTHTQSVWMQGQCAPCPWWRRKCFRRVSWLELVTCKICTAWNPPLKHKRHIGHNQCC